MATANSSHASHHVRASRQGVISCLVPFLLLVPFQPETAAEFQNAVDLEFRIRESINGVTQTATGIATVPIILRTDYSSLNWVVDFTGVAITMAGSPAEPFETILEVDGLLWLTDWLPLSFPDYTGHVLAGYNTLSGAEITYTVTDRIVTVTERHRRSAPIDVTVGNVNTALNVADYPANVDLIVSGLPGGISLGTVSTGPNSSILATMGFRSTSGSFVMTEVLPGDFNSSSSVDAYDYLFYRNGNGLLAPLMVDYQTWKTNFGNSGGGGIEIPEPASFMLLFQCCLIGWLCSAKRHRGRRFRPAE